MYTLLTLTIPRLRVLSDPNRSTTWGLITNPNPNRPTGENYLKTGTNLSAISFVYDNGRSLYIVLADGGGGRGMSYTM